MTSIKLKFQPSATAGSPGSVYYQITHDRSARGICEYTVFKCIEDAISLKVRNGKIRTAETYRAALRSFHSFREGKDLMLDCLTPALMEAYAAWLAHRGLTPNTISFYARILRAIYNRAVEEDMIIDRNPFRHVYTGIDKTVKRALPLNIIKKIKNLDLSSYPAQEYARDLFVMSFMLRGMSFVDMAYLRKTDLVDGYIRYRRRKTGQLLVIKWTDEMQALLRRYPANPTVYLLPIIIRSDINVRNTYRNISYNINHNLKTVGRKAGISVPLTMYVARHSWASAAKTIGIPLSVISEGLGHDSETTTQIYLTSLETTRIDNANALILKSL